MKCWNSTFNAQGSKVIIIVVQVGVVKIYVATAEVLRKKKRMKLSLPPKLVENLVWVLVISFCKIFIPNYGFDALLCRNWPFSPPNCVTLWITLIAKKRLKNTQSFLLKINTLKIHCTPLPAQPTRKIILRSLTNEMFLEIFSNKHSPKWQGWLMLVW
jgi:hypothetical protein